MTPKEQVLNIYPDAIIMRDETPWKKGDHDEESDSAYNTILVREISQPLKQKIVGDCIVINLNFTKSFNKPQALSEWCKNEEDCWENAWKEIQ